MNVGDTIRDVEDSDCYYQGVVISVDPIKYRIDSAVWNGEADDSMIGTVSTLKWWFVQKLIGGNWVKQP